MTKKTNSAVVLFDGPCNLCNALVLFVIRRDAEAKISFASLQSTAGQTLLKKYQLPRDHFRSFVLIDKGQCFLESTAALQMLKHLDGLWPFFSLGLMVPRFLRDGIYQFIAKNRYRWFGARDECMVPTPEIQERFLST